MEPAFRKGGALRDGQLGDAIVQICDVVGCREIMEKVYHHWEFDPFIDNRPMPESWYDHINAKRGPDIGCLAPFFLPIREFIGNAFL